MPFRVQKETIRHHGMGDGSAGEEVGERDGQARGVGSRVDAGWDGPCDGAEVYPNEKGAFGIAAVLDRIVHHAAILELTGPSYRAEAARARVPKEPVTNLCFPLSKG